MKNEGRNNGLTRCATLFLDRIPRNFLETGNIFDKSPVSSTIRSPTSSQLRSSPHLIDSKPSQDSSLQPSIKITPISCEELPHFPQNLNISQKLQGQSSGEESEKEREEPSNKNYQEFLPKKVSEFARSRGKTVIENKKYSATKPVKHARSENNSLFNRLIKEKFKKLHENEKNLYNNSNNIPEGTSPQVSLERSSKSQRKGRDFTRSEKKPSEFANKNEKFAEFFSDLNDLSDNSSRISAKVSPVSKKIKKKAQFFNFEQTEELDSVSSVNSVPQRPRKDSEEPLTKLVFFENTEESANLKEISAKNRPYFLDVSTNNANNSGFLGKNSNSSTLRRSVRGEKKEIIKKDDEGIKICELIVERLNEIFAQEFNKQSLEHCEILINKLKKLKNVICSGDTRETPMKTPYEYQETLEILEFVEKLAAQGRKLLKYRELSKKFVIKDENAEKNADFSTKHRHFPLRGKKKTSCSLEKRQELQQKMQDFIEEKRKKQFSFVRRTKQQLKAGTLVISTTKSKYSDSEKSFKSTGANPRTVRDLRAKTTFSMKYGGKNRENSEVSPKSEEEKTHEENLRVSIESIEERSRNIAEKKDLSIENTKEIAKSKETTPLDLEKPPDFHSKISTIKLKRVPFDEDQAPKPLKINTERIKSPENSPQSKLLTSPCIFKASKFQRPFIKTRPLEYGQFFKDKIEGNIDTRDIRHSPIYKFTKRKSVEVLSPVKKGSPRHRASKHRKSTLCTFKNHLVSEDIHGLRNSKRHFSYQFPLKNNDEDREKEKNKTNYMLLKALLIQENDEIVNEKNENCKEEEEDEKEEEKEKEKEVLDDSESQTDESEISTLEKKEYMRDYYSDSDMMKIEQKCRPLEHEM